MNFNQIRKKLAATVLCGVVVLLASCGNSAKSVLAAASRPISLDRFGGFSNMPSPNHPTGLFRVEKFGDRWMFVDPANNAFFMIGVYALSEDQSTDDRGDTYYHRTTVKYGDAGPNWAGAQLRRVRSWGFNSLGPYASEYVLPTTKDYRLSGDQTQSLKLPFIGLVRPAYYGMLNQNHWAAEPIKDMLYGVSPYYLAMDGYLPRSGVADFYDRNLDIFLANELRNDPYTQSITASGHKQYMIGMSVDDGDQMYGFGKGPDFGGGYNNSHLGWIALTMSPIQTANPNKGFVYQDSTVYSKKALRDQLAGKYKTVSVLNEAWGAHYTTFDSSGKTITAEAVEAGNGSTLTFSKTLTAPAVSKYSLQILVAGKPVGGDTGDGSLWGPNFSGTINYTSGALSITFASGHAPAGGAAITANYIQNGWGIGTGLMDEDGRPSHRRWVGKDFIFLKDVNAKLRIDIDDFLYQIAAHYFSMCRTGIQSWMPGLLYLGPDSLGSWGAPSNRNVLKAAAQFIDVMSIGGGTPVTQAMVDFIHTHYGDKPFYVGEFRTANPDSAMGHSASVPETDYKTQDARGHAYYYVVTTYPEVVYSATGTRPYVGILWWQYLDNWGEKNDWGLVSLSDNAYDGNEARTNPPDSKHSIPCSRPLTNYKCGGEQRNYGDVISWVTAAHIEIQQRLQPADSRQRANADHAK